MKRIRKTKLPKWLISKLPFEHEEETISEILVPVVLFSFIGIGLLWREFYDPKWFFVEIVVAIILLILVLVFAWWLMIQVDVLKICRQELMIYYNLTENLEKKGRIRERLEKFYVFVK